VLEVKPVGHDFAVLAQDQQVAKYLEPYGQILLTNYRSFALYSWEGGKSVSGESFHLAESAGAFWEIARHAKDHQLRSRSPRPRRRRGVRRPRSHRHGPRRRARQEERGLSEACRETKAAPKPQGQGLNELYVRFFRMAGRRIVEGAPDEDTPAMRPPAPERHGIVCYISNFRGSTASRIRGCASVTSKSSTASRSIASTATNTRLAKNRPTAHPIRASSAPSTTAKAYS
jgi:hypothetical protein